MDWIWILTTLSGVFYFILFVINEEKPEYKKEESSCLEMLLIGLTVLCFLGAILLAIAMG